MPCMKSSAAQSTRLWRAGNAERFAVPSGSSTGRSVVGRPQRSGRQCSWLSTSARGGAERCLQSKPDRNGHRGRGHVEPPVARRPWKRSPAREGHGPFEGRGCQCVPGRHGRPDDARKPCWSYSSGHPFGDRARIAISPGPLTGYSARNTSKSSQRSSPERGWPRRLTSSTSSEPDWRPSPPT